ncbi:hypothetical protein VTN96DRAFT_5086 [Rasamsonia emersonii]
MTTNNPVLETDLELEPANLRDDENVFPTLSTLPSTDNIDFDFYNSVDGTFYVPTRHWCLLAEIVNVHFFFRLLLVVRDKAGRHLPVYFYTEERGWDFFAHVTSSVLSASQQNHDHLSLPQQGYTIAILYAHRHLFMDLSVGVKQLELDSIKVSETR